MSAGHWIPLGGTIPTRCPIDVRSRHPCPFLGLSGRAPYALKHRPGWNGTFAETVMVRRPIHRQSHTGENECGENDGPVEPDHDGHLGDGRRGD